MKHWTESEANWLREHYVMLGAAACAEALGRSRAAVFTKANREGIEKSRPWRTSEVAFLQEHYRSHGAKWCAVRLGRSSDAVTSYARHRGLARQRGQKSWTEDEMAVLLEGGTPAELAERLGRTVGSVRMKIAAQRMSFRRYRR